MNLGTIELWIIAWTNMSSPTASQESGKIPVTLDDIRAAHARIAPRIHRTPVLTSSSLDEIAGAHLFFKCENLQKTGSFKIRGRPTPSFRSPTSKPGAGSLLPPPATTPPPSRKPLAGEACVLTSSCLPIRPGKIRAVESYGGEITLCEPNIPSRESTTAAILEKTGAHLVHPYNDARVIAGQGTASLELLEEIPDLDAIIAPSAEADF